MSSITVTVTAENVPISHVGDIRASSVAAVNQFLQLNHDSFHTFFNVQRGLHNHQVHYLLTDLALGASPEQIRGAFESNKDCQRPIEAGDESRQNVITQENFSTSLGRHELYAAWLVFFQHEIDQKGWKDVLSEYVFAENPRAKDLFGRLFEGAIHPIIHLGFGVEFSQPAIVAEALAQAAVHASRVTPYLYRSDTLARQNTPWTDKEHLVELFHAIRSSPLIKGADCFAPGSIERDGDICNLAPQALLDIIAQYALGPAPSEETFKLRLAEMTNVMAWMASAAQNPKKIVKYDFFLMHAVTCSIFLSVFADLPWLGMRYKVRLLEFKVRFDLFMYATQGCPELLTDEITNYAPRRGTECMNWPAVIHRALKIECDGHVVKMIRALHHGSLLCGPFETSEADASKFPIKGQMWLKIANMALDSTEDYPTALDKWIRGPGFEKGWIQVPDRKRGSL